MPDLVAQRFDLSKSHLVESFSCGDDPFSCIATDWIRCVNPADSAAQSIFERQTEVFLYYLENALPPDGMVVGFGSLGKAPRKIRRAEEVWSIIPHVGVDESFKGKPDGVQWHERYAAQI